MWLSIWTKSRPALRHISELLNLTTDGDPLHATVHKTTSDLLLRERLIQAAKRLPHDGFFIEASDLPAPQRLPPEQRTALIRQLATEAPGRFDQALQDFRTLRANNARQLSTSQRLQNEAKSSVQRRVERRRHAQAQRQHHILEGAPWTLGGHHAFEIHRYLQNAGFLPSHHHPHRPIYVSLRGWRPQTDHRSAYYVAPLHAGIHELRPRNTFYHRGQLYRVERATLPPQLFDDHHNVFRAQSFCICPNCGAFTEEDLEICEACGHSMNRAQHIKKALPIHHMEASAQPWPLTGGGDGGDTGQDLPGKIQVAYRWPQGAQGFMQHQATFLYKDAPLFALQWSAHTTVRQVLYDAPRAGAVGPGFALHPYSGLWALPHEGRGVPHPQDFRTHLTYVTPMIETITSALQWHFCRWAQEGPAAKHLFAHYFLHGIHMLYQLPPGTLACHPLPSDVETRSFLFFAASERGVGIVAHLMQTPHALSVVAAKALDMLGCREEIPPKAQVERARQRDDGEMHHLQALTWLVALTEGTLHPRGAAGGPHSTHEGGADGDA